jgi:hypothetical protein
MPVLEDFMAIILTRIFQNMKIYSVCTSLQEAHSTYSKLIIGYCLSKTPLRVSNIREGKF